MNETNIKPTLLDLVGYFLENKSDINNNNEKLDPIYKSIARRAAIKARNKREELISLIEQINEDNIKYCLHSKHDTTLPGKFQTSLPIV